MTDYIDCTPHPALGLAYQIVQALPADSFEFEGGAILDIAKVLMTAERQGRLAFATDCPAPETAIQREIRLIASEDATRDLICAIRNLPDDVINDIMDNADALDAITRVEALVSR